MKQLKFLKALTLAVVTLAAPFVAKSAPMAEGSIYEIRVVDRPGVKTFGERNAHVLDGTLCSAENPLVAGETVYIRVRTLVSNWLLSSESVEPSKPWQWVGTSSFSTYTPALGIFIGDRLEWADYVEDGPETWQMSGLLHYKGEYGEASEDYTYYHDFYFAYTVRAGDIGLPIQLANKSLQKAASTGAGEYALRYVNVGDVKWILSDGDAKEINWQYGSYPMSPRSPEWPEGQGRVGETTEPVRSYDLLTEGAFIKSIDFDTDYVTSDVWRNVYPGMTQTPTGQTKPKLKLVGGAATKETAVYIWSDNENVVFPVADTSTDGKLVSTVGGRQVLTVTVSAGKEEYTFTLKGADAAKPADKAKIYMSASQSAVYLPSGDLLTNAVTRTVQVIDAPSPTVRMYLNGGHERTVLAEPDYKILKGELTFELIPAVDYPVTVDLTATLKGGRSLKALYDDNYLRITEEEGFYIDSKPEQVVIPKNTTRVTRYIYVLGADEDTEDINGGIKFKPALTAGTPAEIQLENKTSTLYIERGGDDHPIAVTAANPAKGSAITVANGEKKGLVYKLNDTYRNQRSSVGYSYVIEDDDSLETLKKETLKPASDGKITWPVTFDQSFHNRHVSVYAVSPDGKTMTEPVRYSITIVAGKSAVIEPWDAASDRMIGEGEVMPVRVGLNQPHSGGNRYIFVKGATDADAALFSSGLTKLGAPVSITDYKSVLNAQKIEFLDGSDSGTAVTVNDYLGNTQTDPSDETGGWGKGTMTVTVTNNPPVLKRLSFNGEILTADDNGKHMTAPVSAKVKKIFKLEAHDVPADLDATGDKAMYWKYNIDGVDSEVRRGNPLGQEFTNEFTSVKSGVKIRVYMADKDMVSDSGKVLFPEPAQFSFTVNVVAQPTVTIETSSPRINEGDMNQHWIKVGLTEAASAEIKVRFTVAQKATGFLKIRTVEGSVDQAKDAQGKDIPGAYDLTFAANDKGPKQLVIAEMDGTVDTEGGVDLNAAVTTETVSEGVAWKDFYTKADPKTIEVVNVEPEITRPSMRSVTVTNGYNVCQMYNVSVNTRYTLEVSASDIVNDLTAEWEREGHSISGLVVQVTGSDLADYTTNITDKAKLYPVPVEFNTPGKEYYVTLTFSDKDGGRNECTVLYKVSSANILTLSAHGPAVASATHTASARYGSASGLGAGRVWAGDAGPNKVNSFVHLYTVDGSKDVTARAYGYKADGRADDGKLATAYDQAIDKYGNWSKSSTISEYYNYTTMHEAGKLGLDSFLYGWVQPPTEGEGTASFLYNIGAEGSATIALTTNKYYEAVFSREYYAPDNCGDINHDKIPDAVVYKYGMGVIDTSTGTASSSTETSGQPGGAQTTTTTTGDDLDDLSDYNGDLDKDGNEDPDYLPITDTAAYAELIPGLKGTWLTVGKEFTVLMETRGASDLGAGDGLNDALSQLGIIGVEPERVYAEYVDNEWKWTQNCTISELEYLAWTEFAVANGLNPNETNDWSKWSPERATSPIKSDTDGDGFTDGYEYYFWYQAHVGYINSKGEHKYLTGRRFDPRNPGQGIEIPSAYIARLMDPRSDLDPVDAWTAEDIARTGLTIDSNALTRDTDNDGLPDLLEFEIGTNPFDFDTDHDGLPDGWEIMVAGLNPLLATSSTGAKIDTLRNYDGDAMAITSPAREANVLPTPLFIQQLQSFAVVDRNGDTDGIQWYVVKPEDAATMLTFEKEDVATFTLVTVGSDVYATTADVKLTADGRLGNELTRDKTFRFVEKATVAGVEYEKVLTTPVTVARGTEVTTEAGTEGCRIKLASVPKHGYCNAAWVYGTDVTGASDYGFLALARYAEPAKDAYLAELPDEKREVCYLHSLVYQEFGFDPRTAWTADSPIASRWTATTSDGQSVSGVYQVRQGGLVNYATRTRDYCTYDEFLVHSFFLNNGVSMSGSTYVTPSGAPNWANVWGSFTTNPQGPNEPELTQLSVSEATAAEGSSYYFGRESENGADTDGDGVPDGWELYIMAGPKLAATLTTPAMFNFAPPYAGFKTSFGGTPEESYWSPFVGKANDTETTNQIYLGGQANMDDLNELREFSGTDSCAYYAEFSTTILKREEQVAGAGGGLYTADDSKWLNKFLPSDPWTIDTDGDGVSDSAEGQVFVYGTPTDDGKVWSVVGGGLNPCSVDTDLDGLPDGWETQFAGKWDEATGVQDAKHGIVNGMDGTVKDAVTAPGGVNRDYDHDGLENWQEYLTGTMRCWRYDDPLSRWDAIPSSAYYVKDEDGNDKFDALHAATNLLGTVRADGLAVTEDDFWYATLVNPASGFYNPRLVTDVNPAEYMTQVKNAWDPAFYNADLVGDPTSDVHAGGAYYWFYGKIDGVSVATLWGDLNGTATSTPTKYACCSPLSADSDQDGMDDYYELFHGLNPLLGASGVKKVEDGKPCDLIADAWAGSGSIKISAWGNDSSRESGVANYWLTKEGKKLRKPRGSEFDFVAYPWLNGLAGADPDGDDILNQTESLMPTVANAGYHTDPTPLWMTDATYTNSYTYLYYRMPTRYGAIAPGKATFTNVVVKTEGEGDEAVTKTNKTVYAFRNYAGTYGSGNKVAFQLFAHDLWKLTAESAGNWMYSFEENEGYDTDHDGFSDYAETAGKYGNATDALDADWEHRRQAMWFPGENAVLQTMPQTEEIHPLGGKCYLEDPTFKTFTVECWAKPTAEMLTGTHVVIERATWVSPTKVADQEYIRKNFQIALKDGKWFGKYDPQGTLTMSEVSVVDRNPATLDWTHVALTFDGATLTLYVNGSAVRQIAASLPPENGVYAMAIRGDGAYWGNLAYDHEKYAMQYANLAHTYNYVAMIVGGSLKTQQEFDPTYQPLGQKNAVKAVGLALNLQFGLGWDYYTRFFKGYVDEVRVWDGARSAEEIANAMMTRYTADLAKANRDAFYAQWALGKYRYVEGVTGVVPELRYHFSFDSVPSAENANVVAKAPDGFDNELIASNRPADYQIGWWAQTLEGYTGTVYSNPSWVQWIPNTMAHLPRYDGTTLDSQYWSDNYMGAVRAEGVGDWVMAKSAEPVSMWTQIMYAQVSQSDEYQSTSHRHWWVNNGDTNSTESLVTAFAFTGRHLNQVGDDLIPLGGTYAKYVSQAPGLWDKEGATTAYEATGHDEDMNGLPDWWEEYAKGKGGYTTETELKWNSTVTYDGREMTAGEAYLRDLEKGYYADANEKIVTTDDAYAQTADDDHDGLADAWEKREFGNRMMYNGEDDPDGDGLSNYAEYLITEVLKVDALDPNDPKTDGYCLDYFRKFGQFYLGEIFTDHDQVDDQWENAYAVKNEIGKTFASAGIYDPTRDTDEDGWSNYAEAKAGTDPTAGTSLSFGGYTLPQYPVPVIKAEILYNGSYAIDGPIVVKAWNESTDPDMTGLADAQWTIGTVTGESESEDKKSSSAQNDESTDTLAESVKYVGLNKALRRELNLGPKAISQGSVKVCFLDTAYDVGAMSDGKFVTTGSGRAADAGWYCAAMDNGDGEILAADGTSVGTIDYTTGQAMIDFTLPALRGELIGSSENSWTGTGSSASTNVHGTVSRLDMSRSHVLIAWEGKQIGLTGAGTYYLSDVDPVEGSGDILTSKGHVREGLNTFVVYVADDAGNFVPGKPFGVVRGVDVGWSGAKFMVDLSETIAISPRLDLTTDASDRGTYLSEQQLEDYEHRTLSFTNSIADNVEAVTIPAATKAQVRVVRYGVNDFYAFSCGVVCKTVMDKTLDMSSRSFLCEADFLGEDQFDIDWDDFYRDCTKAYGCKMATDSVNGSAMISNMTYLVVIGEGSSAFRNLEDTNTFIKATGTRIVRRFEICRSKPVISEPNMTLYEARPTFRWRMPNEETYAKAFGTSYTAFRVQVLSSDEKTVVYDSGYQRTPVQRLSKTGEPAEFVWTAPVCVGDLTDQGMIFANNTTYRWRVSMYNSKFKDDKWSESGWYTTAINLQPINHQDYSSIGVSVKYTGHTNVLEYVGGTKMRGKLRVQAFTSPDFTGDPVASAVVQDRKSIQDTTDTSANATLIGLPVPGTYYIRAFLDSDGNGKKDVFESWGAAKAPVVLSEKNVQPLVKDLYLDDADENDNKIPDAYEYTLGDFAWRGAWDSRKGEIPTTVVTNGTIAFASNVVSAINVARANMSRSLDMPLATLALVQNPTFAGMICGLGGSVADTAEWLETEMKKEVAADTVRVTNLVLDQAAGKVTLYTDAELAYVNPESAEALAKVFDESTYAPKSVSVTVNVFFKTALDQPWSETPFASRTVEIGNGEQAVEVDFDGIDFSSGFFKIEVVQ